VLNEKNDFKKAAEAKNRGGSLTLSNIATRVMAMYIGIFDSVATSTMFDSLSGMVSTKRLD